jgi:Ca2+-binding EF-hand superfamily protein
MAFAAAAVTAARRRSAVPSHIPANSAARREAYEEQQRFWADLVSADPCLPSVILSKFLLQEQQAHFRELRDLIKKYDEDRSGNLNTHELGKCIKAYSDARQWTLQPVSPTEEEVNLILHAAGKQKKNAVDASELEFALDLWHSYVTNKSKIEDIFEKYDTNHSDKLEFDQLSRYLTDLNEGHAPKVTVSDLCSDLFS